MTRCAFLLGVVLLGVIAVGGQVPHDRLGQNVPPAPSSDISVQKDISYGTVGGHALLLDIYRPGEPSSDSRPAVVLIHGGAWTSFDKATMQGMGTFLARSGFVAFAVDYRLLQGTENRWPAQLDDVQRAVRWVRANAAKYRVDPEHVGAFGHSAGAQLACLLGLEDTRDNTDKALANFSSRVQAVVDVSGPSDFTTNRDADRDAFFASFLGGDYDHAEKTWQDASPVFHVSKHAAPFLIVHGSKDADVPMAQSEELAKMLKHAHVPVKFVTVDDGHTFTTPEARKRLALETRAFFAQYLGPESGR